MDLQTEKTIEAMIEIVADEMGLDSASQCYSLGRFQEMLMEMKSSSNSEILRQMGYTKKVINPAGCERCGKCSTTR